MRREMEKTARNLKMELREEQQQLSLKDIELERVKQRLSTTELTNVKLTKECELKVFTFELEIADYDRLENFSQSGTISLKLVNFRANQNSKIPSLKPC